ncbi:MAG: N-acetyltransferase [Anaerolineales bacterium]|nr:N-acetyltransferase [Anaerolineales bacterium]
MIIRKEKPADIEAITSVTVEAFTNHPTGGELTEHFIILALRAADALAISLVAEIDGEIVGHIAFSPVTIADGTEGWYGLGPVSVLPEYQKQGIGKALINEGLSKLREMDAGGCALVGEPEYYKRFGFRNNPGLIYEGINQAYFLVFPFTDTVPEGIVTFHEGFLAIE